MLRAIREIQPRWVVGENVRGLTNWNGGLVFDEVQADLENEGYEVTPYLLPACAVNAPHRRDRIWFIAHRYEGSARPPGSSRSIACNGCKNDAKPELWREQAEQHFGCGELLRTATNAQQVGQSRQGRPIGRMRTETGGNWKASWSYDDGRWPTQSPICQRNDGLSNRLVGITVSKHREKSIGAFGNAIVPQVALEIFKAIQESEK